MINNNHDSHIVSVTYVHFTNFFLLVNVLSPWIVDFYNFFNEKEGSHYVVNLPFFHVDLF